jgi:hypothetical protein
MIFLSYGIIEGGFMQAVQSVSYTGNNIVVGLFDKVLRGRRNVALIVKYVWQALGVAILVYFGMLLFKLVGVTSFGEYIRAFFAGLTFKANTLEFYNGTVAVVAGLMVVYGALSALSFTKAVYICDLGIIYTLLYSSMHLNQFTQILAPLGLLYAIWIIHRMLLASVVLYYKKTKEPMFIARTESGENDEQ